jgi:hypothetical protein
MLHLVQRQKQGVHDNILSQNMEPIEHTAPTNTPAQELSVDQEHMFSIVSDIAAIKRCQIAIEKDLNLLKGSSQQLWKEAIVSRDKHKTQQGTIDRIVEFLAGVFGSSAPLATGEPNLARPSVPHLSQKQIGMWSR